MTSRGAHPPIYIGNSSFRLYGCDNQLISPQTSSNIDINLLIKIPRNSVGLISGIKQEERFLTNSFVISATEPEKIILTIFNATKLVFKIRRSTRLATLTILPQYKCSAVSF